MNNIPKEVKQFEHAVREHEMMGSQPKEYHMQISEAYISTLVDLIIMIKNKPKRKRATKL